MAWFLVVWACLTAALAVTTAFLSVAVFRHFDLRYVTLVQLLIIPTVQALVVGWVRCQWSLSQLARAAGAALRQRSLTALLILDLGVLCIDSLGGWFTGDIAEDRVRLVATWSALKAAGAGALLLAALLRAHGGWRQRPWLVALAVWALAVAAEPMFHWLGATPDLLNGLVPKAVRWLVTYGGMAAIGLIVLVRSASTVRDTDPVAAFLLDLTATLLFAMMLVVVLNVSLHPFLTEPWATMVAVMALLGGSSVCAGALLVSSTRRPSGE
jgi:hypothetical protein